MIPDILNSTVSSHSKIQLEGFDCKSLITQKFITSTTLVQIAHFTLNMVVPKTQGTENLTLFERLIIK